MKVILTCRTTYLQNISDQTELLSIPENYGLFKTIYINSFNDEEQQEFIKKFVEQKSQKSEYEHTWEVSRFIREISNFEGLSELSY